MDKLCGVKPSTLARTIRGLVGEEATLYRRGVAIVNFLAQDRGDLSYASKELSRRMSSPMASDLPAMKRVARYLGRIQCG